MSKKINFGDESSRGPILRDKMSYDNATRLATLPNFLFKITYFQADMKDFCRQYVTIFKPFILIKAAISGYLQEHNVLIEQI